jgi:hypothetical protein
MTRLLVDEHLSAKLPTLCEPVELCDTQGRVIGKYFPAIDLSKYGPLEPQVSDEELRRRATSNEKTYTTEEVIKYLESL